MPVAIKGSGGGSVTLDAGAAAADTTLTIPNITGTVLQSGTAVTVAQGGTGAATLTANAVLIGNGTSALQVVAPGTTGNLLTSNGTTWQSTAPVATASLTLLATLTTTSGTTQSATSLATTYTNLVCVYDAVTNSTGSDGLTIAASSNNGSSYGASVVSSNGSPTTGIQQIWRANSSSTTHPSPYFSFQANQLAGLVTTTAAPINALRFGWNSGYTFSGGTIYIYGWN
jgi:hypothetical protein